MVTFNENKRNLKTQGETRNFEGGRAYEPQSPERGLYEVVVNNLLENSYYESGEESLEKQKSALKKFVELSKELDKPIIVHSRKAETETIEFLESLEVDKVLMHCFSGKKKLIRKIIDNGWHLSVPANIKNATHFQKLVELTPIGQLFCETDSPFLHPDKLPDNEPANVVESYKKIAEIKNLDLKKIEKQIEENYYKLFENPQ